MFTVVLRATPSLFQRKSNCIKRKYKKSKRKSSKQPPKQRKTEYYKWKMKRKS